ncbi:vacuolar protein sorting-associated protein 13a [Quercus suber]|uniref:Vacuolar protein sorting-associated protein 13a n=1 Tax=Quercus suber TaxID=58331 RepID=A0AAW0IHN7_QUESU
MFEAHFLKSRYRSSLGTLLREQDKRIVAEMSWLCMRMTNGCPKVLHLLRRYLGEYVHGLSVEALRISVPWKSLGKEPVIVLIDRVFVLAHPAPDGRTLKEEDREKLFEAKRQQIEEAESATLEAISRSKLGSPPPGNSWLGSLIATIIGNLKISISNVHFRYEDSVSNPGHPFSSGVTLAKLAAVTMDEQGNETFDTSGALDKLRKVSNPGHPFSSGVTLAKLAAVTMDEQGNETFDTSGALDKLRKADRGGGEKIHFNESSFLSDIIDFNY